VIFLRQTFEIWSKRGTGGIRQNFFYIYYFEKLHAPRARGAHARALAPRAEVGGMSQL
jgi:hypothetical protein